VLGRSDATLNRGGIRMGSEEYYAVLGQRSDISDSLIIDVATENGGSELILFVVPAPGTAWTDQAGMAIRAHIRTELSPRHVPDHVYPLTGVPRTLSGKRLEIPVKRLMTGEPLETALSLETVANPGSLTEILGVYRDRAAMARPPARTRGTRERE
jgi:acetoacetyl-CoA synthetase